MQQQTPYANRRICCCVCTALGGAVQQKPSPHCDREQIVAQSESRLKEKHDITVCTDILSGPHVSRNF